MRVRRLVVIAIGSVVCLLIAGIVLAALAKPEDSVDATSGSVPDAGAASCRSNARAWVGYLAEARSQGNSGPINDWRYAAGMESPVYEPISELSKQYRIEARRVGAEAAASTTSLQIEQQCSTWTAIGIKVPSFTE